MGKRKRRKKIENVKALFIYMVPPLFVIFAVRNEQSMRQAITLCVYILIAEFATRELDSKQNPTVEEHIVLRAWGMLSFFMISMVILGDRTLSALGFVAFVGLLYMYIAKKKTMSTGQSVNSSQESTTLMYAPFRFDQAILDS